MRDNILSNSKLSCTGCGACYATCHAKAISIEVNADGFFAPTIDSQRCTGCGLCKRVCYRFESTSDMDHISDKIVYGCHSTNTHTHSTTTSGGIGYEIAKWGINHGYKILGVRYNYHRDEAESIVVDTLSELEQIKGSKYVQSNTSTALSHFVEIAKNNPNQGFILFGTPCQIFGIRKLMALKRLENDIILVDLYCHGVPSYLVWKPYIKEHKRQLGELKSVNFRYKGNGWHQYSIRVDGAHGTYTGMAYNDTFYRYFFDNMALNASCYDCTLRKRDCAADIRLGDFLGRAFESREDGISAVSIISERGTQIIEDLTNSGAIDICGKFDSQVCLQAQSTHDYSNRLLRDSVIARLKSDGITKTQRWYFKQLPLKTRVRSHLKRVAAKLPLRVIIALRRVVRKINII